MVNLDPFDAVALVVATVHRRRERKQLRRREALLERLAVEGKAEVARLDDLRAKGAISDADYERERQKLIQSIMDRD